ncbi:MAG: LacI family DNA-binding transcriptional regulator [bacterium]|nr:LacI family DNA-binding transcriptional regulator [bacterium]
MVRIKDIAQVAGVSTTTVSNVIHGNLKKVSPENVKKIQSLLEQMDYIPSMGARMLAGKASCMIGVILPLTKERSLRQITDPFLSTILGAIEAEAYEANYYVIFHQADSSEDMNVLVSKWNVDGLISICMPDAINEKAASLLKIPFVTVDGYYEKQEIFNVGLDDVGGGYDMAAYLLQQGHKKLYYLADGDTGANYMRWLGVKRALEERGRETKGCFLQIPCEWEERRSFYQRRLKLLSEADALFFASDYYAMDAILFLEEQGIQVPDKVSVAGFDDSFLASLCHPALTTVRQDIEKKGRLAVQLLLGQIRGESCEQREIRLPVELIKRETVRVRES